MFNPKLSPKFSRCSESGYTLLESIMAMVVVSILMVGISPVLGFAFATRVQARRIELASRAANSYISAVRADPTNEDLVDLNPSDPDAGPTSPDHLFCVDNDGSGGCNSTTDMMVQGIGINECSNDNLLEDGYKLIVRVYRADAFAQSEGPRGSGHVASSRVGLADPRDPLVEVRTEISPSSNNVFSSLQRRLAECRED
ncbi:MAG: prepilin-type N-terminal cleavage/methylation domain-containing protein [Limnospira sp. PMC 1291.21]|uniref:prepilin-type N-terminal cleavage/methylation domain-containing protein n=1 Tax=unclassified Limnospira TaxID=2642885 RepID=UPI0028E12F07|nr:MULTISPECIES: prepilin-type N-terminal cleavage/methylation domain-containing protein [unclassified Limnospira]MDT9176430.1 prepilin-type N-terminal cleavage/methylation domain-containing protein [Limnospira sp. PMC 1238.20]MDT9212461.1 prepilin-type N-terminal cleavage/methylation domain-containing protein [Limnospira sp. PMC 1256.20]MDT9217473.1 prepilin-type N-terminal cleavage/methylation domain-containing protein [Limnospira sp. PMC 1240.20]MDT9222619.1 prepilin-type N-terminal cleavage